MNYLTDVLPAALGALNDQARTLRGLTDSLNDQARTLDSLRSTFADAYAHDASDAKELARAGIKCLSLSRANKHLASEIAEMLGEELDHGRTYSASVFAAALMGDATALADLRASRGNGGRFGDAARRVLSLRARIVALSTAIDGLLGDAGRILGKRLSRPPAAPLPIPEGRPRRRPATAERQTTGPPMTRTLARRGRWPVQYFSPLRQRRH